MRSTNGYVTPVRGLIGLRLKALMAFAGLSARLGLGDTLEQLIRLPIARRKVNKAAGWMTYPLPPDVATSYRDIASRSGPLMLKEYRPPQLNVDAPRVLFVHGGGWLTGGVDTLDYLCASLSRSARCLVLSVDYRLAPETQFPGGLEDCYDALQWLASDTSLGPVPAAGVAIVGESAGANLAAALCVLNARRGGPAICHQTLIYPCVDATLQSPSMGHGPPGFQKKEFVQLIDNYRGSAALTDPLLSPLFAENHAQLPPALIITADLDPARDDGSRYARCLTDAGVQVRYLNYVGMPHGFFFMPRICKAADEAIREIAAEISLRSGRAAAGR